MSQHQSVPASHYDFNQLADIYNQARVDYIVPMPMNGKRMKEYVLHYDITLEGSVVSLNDNSQETGVGMLGLRDDRAWITRLGVIPQRRGRKLGQYLMECMLENAIQAQCRLVQLEVIVGNEPAHNLFLKLGFEETRELLVIRRPPGPPPADDYFDLLEPIEIPAHQIPAYLAQRETYASWVEETRSLMNMGNLYGLYMELSSDEKGWIIFQKTAFQLQHFVMCPNISEKLGLALLYHVHKTFPMLDTKIENIPANHHTWSIYEQSGYIEAFRRTEMYLYF